jgi:hypothetical protein
MAQAEQMDTRERAGATRGEAAFTCGSGQADVDDE